MTWSRPILLRARITNDVESVDTAASTVTVGVEEFTSAVEGPAGLGPTQELQMKECRGSGFN